MTSLLWFRQDLRLADNPALTAAIAARQPIVPVFIFSPEEEERWAPGSASQWWLHASLQALAAELEQRGSRLIVRAARYALIELEELLRETGAARVLWNRRFEPAVIARDRIIKAALRDRNVIAESYNAALLREPWEVKTQSNSPYQVFTPFWRRCLTLPDPPLPAPAPQRVDAPQRWPRSLALAELKLLPAVDWTQGLHAAWQPGSRGASEKLQHFLMAVNRYEGGRDHPGDAATSGLSPHLHFGEIGPREIWHRFRAHALLQYPHGNWREARFLTEIGWREFAHHLLYHFPASPEHAMRVQFEHFPWKEDRERLRAWRTGSTGYPIVDAGMRQLWNTGWMHNRVRMIVASFLVKDLLIKWQAGAAWFWDTLVDADLANNTLGWQWSAGCGADAAPYFRIFNPVSQGRKFDADAIYVRRWIPEIAKLDSRWIHEPWNAPMDVLASAGVQLGGNYPLPIIDHSSARVAALAALAQSK